MSRVLSAHLRLVFAACLTLVVTAAAPTRGDASNAQAIASVQPKVVKLYGAGGVRGLEEYQSGFLISADGHILTVWSYVLDADTITATLDDGRKFHAELVGADPRLEIAVLKIKAKDLPYFNLDAAVDATAGTRVLAFSNLYGVATGNESVSVLHGVVAATTKLSARRGAFQSPYQGPIYALDAMTNNPGAAGGALTDRQGRLVGLLGKELRNAQNNTWLNYAVPISELIPAVEDIKAGKTRPRSSDDSVKRPTEAHSLAALGIGLVPDILPKTPPFVDRVERGSPAGKAGLRADDLILYVNGRVAASCKTLADEIALIDVVDEVRFTVQRDSELVEIVIAP